MSQADAASSVRISLAAGAAAAIGLAFWFVTCWHGTFLGQALGDRDRSFLAGLSYACSLGLGIGALRAPRTGFLASLLFLGGLAQLWFTDSDWFSPLHFHFALPLDFLMLSFLALELVVVLLLALTWLRRWKREPSSLRGLGYARIALLILLTVITSTTLSSYVANGAYDRYLGKMVVGGGLAVMHMGLLAGLLGAADFAELWRPALRRFWCPRALPWALAALPVLVSSALALFSFHSLGLVEDETAYLFQAKTFAQGHLTAPPLPPGTANAFHFYLIHATNSGWYATTSPGWPAVLSLGVLLGAPWLVNPLLGGLSVLLGHRLIARLGDLSSANIFAFLMATSPWLLTTSASLMTHALSLVLILGAWLMLVVATDWYKDGRAGAAAALVFGAGSLMGWLFLTRALEGVVIGVLSGLWLIWVMRAKSLWLATFYGAGCIAVGSLIFFYNTHFTGDPLLTPLAAYLTEVWKETSNDFGFGLNVGPPPGWAALDLWPGHSPQEGLINTIDGVRSLNLEMFGWGAGSLLLVWIYLLWANAQTLPRLMALFAAAIIGVHFFYWFNAIFYVGPRYWYAAMPALVVLSTFGAVELSRRLGALELGDSRERVAGVLFLLGLFAVTVFTPWRAIDKFAVRARVGSEIQEVAARPDMRNSIMFLSAKTYRAAAILNDPFLPERQPIFVRDLGAPNNAHVLSAFPQRRAVYETVPENGND